MFTITVTSVSTGSVLAVRSADDLSGALATKSDLLKNFHRDDDLLDFFPHTGDFDDWDDRARSIPVLVDITNPR